MRRTKKIVFTVIMALLIATAAAHAAASPSLLKQGMSGDDIYKLQAKLLEFGYYEDTPDGNFGSQTKLAVLEFQLDVGLEADGVAGPATIKALRDFKPADGQPSRAQAETRKAQQLVAFAKKFVGVPYVWAGRSPGGFDCSGYIWYVYNTFGIQLPRMADGQFEVGVPVSRRHLAPGDLVFFSTYEPGPSHVGIYIGGGKFIHASSGAEEVTVTPLNKQYYLERYLGARRIIR
ncbi:NlpC/P60 family protein [Anaeroselena agilis]|uniref:NlpC/P60 family protein n=1 Tax=Anaeroselena agilis TaxID=3063788 RepID=A0ABU3NXT4_9FIRM|nr:NlpC/P60 family protein [Selenomonadales bacterium 4137-cl]